MTYEKLPLKGMLKGKMLKIAELQDKLIIEMSSRFEVVLHGGTAIWRIYRGRRFSFDIDLYYANPPEILEYFEKAEAFNLVRSRLTGSGVLYLRFQEDGILVEVEVSPMFKKLSATDGEFWLAGGDSIIVRTLSPEELLKEKTAAFRSRKKARDLYDIFCLLNVSDASKIKNEIKCLMPLLNNSPEDFPGLKELVLVGKAPDFETIARKVKRYAKD